jgi:CHAD domain-containing protein
MSIAPDRIRLLFQKLDRDAVKLSSKLKPENVHRFRTTTRRLQTLLQELTPKRDRNQKKLLKLLIHIRRRAGKVRDLDVQLSTLRSLKIPQDARRKTQLMHTLIELRTRYEKKLERVVSKESLREIRKRLKRASKDFDAATSRDPLAVAKEMLRKVGPIDGPLTEDVLHQYRILGKRARYAAEFAPNSPETVQFLAQLKRVQDAVGDWHDWLTLTQTAAGRLGEVHESSLVATLHNVTGAKFRNAVAVLSASRDALVASGQATPQFRPLKREVKAEASAARVTSAA